MILFRWGFCGFGFDRGETNFTPVAKRTDKKKRSYAKYWGFKFGIFSFIRLTDSAFLSMTDALKGLERDKDWMVKNHSKVQSLLAQEANKLYDKYKGQIANLRTEISELHEKLGKTQTENHTLRRAFKILEQTTEEK